MAFENSPAEGNEPQTPSRVHSRDDCTERLESASAAASHASDAHVRGNPGELDGAGPYEGGLSDELAERLLEENGYEREIAWVKKAKPRKSNRSYREKKKKQGIEQVNVEAPVIWHEQIKRFAKYACSCLEAGCSTEEMIRGVEAALTLCAEEDPHKTAHHEDP